MGKKKRAEKIEEAWNVNHRLLEETHQVWMRLAAANECSRAQLALAGHGVECACRLCRAARTGLGIQVPLQQPLVDL
jgi:hypothetical protein